MKSNKQAFDFIKDS